MYISEQRVRVNGVSLWTATQGGGPPAVLCHGGPGIYDYLEPVAAMIHDLVTVHRYDQRGCGRSQDKLPCDVASFVADLDALRAHWGYESWTVIGHSWGAFLALLYAVEHPHRVSRLVYFSGTGIDPAWHREYRRNLDAKLSQDSRERLHVLDRRRSSAVGEDLARIQGERSALLETTNYYDAARLHETPQFDRFPINYTKTPFSTPSASVWSTRASYGIGYGSSMRLPSSWTVRETLVRDGPERSWPACSRTAAM